MLELLQQLGASNGEIAERLDVTLDFLSTIALYLTIALVIAGVVFAKLHILINIEIQFLRIFYFKKK